MSFVWTAERYECGLLVSGKRGARRRDDRIHSDLRVLHRQNENPLRKLSVTAIERAEPGARPLTTVNRKRAPRGRWVKPACDSGEVMPKGRYWTGWEISFLRTHHRKAKAKTLASILKRSEQSIYLMASQIGVSVKNPVSRRKGKTDGWPKNLSPREVDILNFLWESGPSTRRQICEGIGLRWRGSRKSMTCPGKGGSYLAKLIRRGLVVRINKGNPVFGQGRGRTCDLYSLPLFITKDAACE